MFGEANTSFNEESRHLGGSRKPFVYKGFRGIPCEPPVYKGFRGVSERFRDKPVCF